MRNYTTRFMSRLFSATEEGDEELTDQVAQDIQDAQRHGAVDTDEVRYENNGDGSVSVIDKDNGEVTVAEQAEDGNFDLYAMPTENLEGYLHPEMDGVTPGYQQGVPGEDAWAHLEDGMISPNVPGYGLNPEAGYEHSVEDIEPCDDCDEREFSVSTDNMAVLKIFSDQEFCERVFSEVIESEETANVGDLKIEKIDDDTVVVTSKSTGDQAKVTLGDDEMQVDELSTKDGGDEREFSDDEEGDYEEGCCDGGGQYDALHVVGIDPVNHVIVDAPEYDEDSAQDLMEQLSAQGVQGVEVFTTPEEARDHAMDLLENIGGVESTEDVEEPEQAEFSDHMVYCTRYYSSRNNYMERLFSEAEEGISTSQDEIEDAIENGDEIENDDEIITPIDSTTAVVEDKKTGEFTKVVLDGDEMECNDISKSEAEDLTKDLVVEDDDDEDEEEEKDFSDYLEDLYYAENYFSDYDDDDYEDRYFSDYEDEGEILSNDENTKFFSEYEDLTHYQLRLFSDDADEKEIEKAIEDGEQIENDTEIITPVDDETAVIEDKETGEFTKAVMDDDTFDISPITEEEADELTEGLGVEDTDEDEDEEEEEKSYSELLEDYYMSANPVLQKFFAETAPQGPEAGGDVQQLFDAEGNPVPFGIDPEGNPVPLDGPQGGDPGMDPNAPQGGPQQGPGAPSVESIEDSADQAVNMIQQAAQEAANQILQAKQQPVEGQEQDLQEAQFSEYYDSPLISWINGGTRY